MGVAGSKDDRGVRVLQALPPGFLDEKGKELRNNLDYCLEQNGWYFTIAGLVLTVPICFRYKTERPFYVAAILSPMADMYTSTLRCTEENEAFSQHYKYLHKKYHMPVWRQQQEEEGPESVQQQHSSEQGPSRDGWQPQGSSRQGQQQQQQQSAHLQQQEASSLGQQQQQQQQQQQTLGAANEGPQQTSKWWWQ